jgi:2-oxoisovalerate dehydrogenase E1 component
MLRDDRVFMMGEDIGAYGGCYAVSMGLLARNSAPTASATRRCRNPVSPARASARRWWACGPIVEIMTVNFSLLALDQILNTAATIRHMSGGQFGVPLVIRMATGAGRQLAAQHSHSWRPSSPISPACASWPPPRWKTRAACWHRAGRPRPGDHLEHVMLYNMTGKIAANAGAVDIDRAVIRRPGRDVTLIAWSYSLWKALEAAEALAKDGIEAEVIDLRSLRPLDDETIMASVARTRRAVVVDEGWRTGSLSAEIAARMQEACFWQLDAPVAGSVRPRCRCPTPSIWKPPPCRRWPISSPRSRRCRG